MMSRDSVPVRAPDLRLPSHCGVEAEPTLDCAAFTERASKGNGKKRCFSPRGEGCGIRSRGPEKKQWSDNVGNPDSDCHLTYLASLAGRCPRLTACGHFSLVQTDAVSLTVIQGLSRSEAWVVATGRKIPDLWSRAPSAPRNVRAPIGQWRNQLPEHPWSHRR